MVPATSADRQDALGRNSVFNNYLSKDGGACTGGDTYALADDPKTSGSIVVTNVIANSLRADGQSKRPADPSIESRPAISRIGLPAVAADTFRLKKHSRQ